MIQNLGRPLGEPSASGELQYNCPKCSVGTQKYRLYVNIKKDVFYCFRCGWRGRASELGIRVYKVVNKKVQLVEKLNYPKIPGFVKMNSSNWGEQPWSYLDDRNITFKRAVKMGVGVSTHPKLEGRLVIPIVEGGRVVYWVARSCKKEIPSFAKEIGPDNSAGFMNRREVVYGIDEVREGMVVVITEGIFDAEHIRHCGAYNTCAVSILGSKLSDVQLGKIISKKPSEIVLMFDGDDAGYYGSAKASEMIKNRWRGNLSRIILPEGKDPDDMNPKFIKQVLEKD